jgi:hypothetical protein
MMCTHININTHSKSIKQSSGRPDPARQRGLPGKMSNRAAGGTKTLLPVAVGIGDVRVGCPVTWSSLTIKLEPIVGSRRQSHGQPTIPPNLREKVARSGEFRR